MTSEQLSVIRVTTDSPKEMRKTPLLKLKKKDFIKHGIKNFLKLN